MRRTAKTVRPGSSGTSVGLQRNLAHTDRQPPFLPMQTRLNREQRPGAARQHHQGEVILSTNAPWLSRVCVQGSGKPPAESIPKANSSRIESDGRKSDCSARGIKRRIYSVSITRWW